jgi:regulator of protease activity HflC (stomatin/prohibitin superfamily)
MNTKEFQYQGMLVNGFLMLFLNLLVIPALVVSSFLVFGSESAVTIAATVLLSILFILITPGYFSQEPNEARVMVFFGKYEGTFTSTGFFWVNPFMNKKKLSFRARNLDVAPIKVNDKIGNPVEVNVPSYLPKKTITRASLGSCEK